MAPTSQSTSNNIIHIPYEIKVNADKAFSEYVLESLQKYSDTIAQIDWDTGKTETFGELLNRSIALAQALKTKGITTDDIVGICCQNNMDYISVIIASIFIGARFCSTDVTAAPSAIVHCLKLITPTVIFCEQESEDLLESTIKEAGLKCEIITFDKTDKHISMEDFVEQFRPNEKFTINTLRTLRDSHCVSFTSGTTGLPKGALLSNFGLYYGSILVTSARSDMKTVLCCSLPYWIANITYCCSSIFGGIARVIYRRFDLKTFVKVIQDYKVNNTVVSQLLINNMINNPEVCEYDTTSLKSVYFVGSKMGPNLIAKIRKLLPHTEFLNGYGMTESCGLICVTNEVVNEENNFSAGTLMPGVYYKVVDPKTGENLGPNKHGELQVKYDGMCNGYLHDPQATAQAFDEQGYYKTGDLVYYDNNYNFYVVGRLKEIYKYHSHHISPVIIEDTLALHPDVKDCAIVPVPHELDCNHAMAVIRLAENAKTTEQDVIQFIAERLSDLYHLRAGVKFVDSIPRTGTGKIQRNDLRDQILKQI